MKDERELNIGRGVDRMIQNQLHRRANMNGQTDGRTNVCMYEWTDRLSSIVSDCSQKTIAQTFVKEFL